MMDIQPIEFEEEPQSPENIRFRNVTLRPYSDGRRVKVRISITPAITPPNIEVNVTDDEDIRVANVSIIGASGPNLDITLHLGGELRTRVYTVLLTLGYQGDETIDRKEIKLQMPDLDI